MTYFILESGNKGGMSLFGGTSNPTQTQTQGKLNLISRI